MSDSAVQQGLVANDKSELLVLLTTLAVVVAGCIFLLKEGASPMGISTSKKNGKKKWPKKKTAAVPVGTPSSIAAESDAAKRQKG